MNNLAKFYIYVKKNDGSDKEFKVQFVTTLPHARVMTMAIRAIDQDVTVGYDMKFKGQKMSTSAQKRAAFAFMSRIGYKPSW